MPQTTPTKQPRAWRRPMSAGSGAAGAAAGEMASAPTLNLRGASAPTVAAGRRGRRDPSAPGGPVTSTAAGAAGKAGGRAAQAAGIRAAILRKREEVRRGGN